VFGNYAVRVWGTESVVISVRTAIDLNYIQTFSSYRSYVSVIQTSQLMLYGEIIAVRSEIHTKHINTVCGQN